MRGCCCLSQVEIKDSLPKDVAVMVETLLKAKAELLMDCVGLEIDERGRLLSLPAVIDHYVPDMDRLPGFVLRLALDVDWSDEKPCFATLAQACLMLSFSLHPNKFSILKLFCVCGGGEPGARRCPSVNTRLSSVWSSPHCLDKKGQWLANVCQCDLQNVICVACVG